ncbi:hypothetical protein BBJ28_00017814 [Nothophytophthora sp. Chile5]|nr:hypothetical protein BBJ28_00017814 [Nothophytophthora sp. Chile5]
MRCFAVLSLALAASLASAASSSSSGTPLNGWYPCSQFTFADEGGSGDQNAECAVYTAPLCYAGICDAPDSVDATVDIFVKRLPVVSGDPDSATNSAMVELQSRLDGAVNVYTMDHRGTGRSTLFDCVAAQATTTGSPWGNGINVSEVPACAQALEIKYGSNLASFSITTVATDIATFISEYSNGADTIVYGVSYGTAVVERLIHLAPPEVTGYVLDGVATSSGSSADKVEYFSKWDVDFGEVGDAFLALCGQDSTCNSRFESRNLSATIQDLITQFDNEPDSQCASLLSSWSPDAPASYLLRSTLGTLLQSAGARSLIPILIYRLNRCASKDIDVVAYFLSALNQYESSSSEDSAFESTLLYYLIVFSEMWEKPEPSVSDMLARFTDTRASGGMYSTIPQYCAFSKENSAACNALDFGGYEASSITYERDEYWNKAATIPSQASVLLLSSKLDPQTPHKFAEYLLKALDGDKKDLVTFEYATHGTLWSTPLSEDDPYSATCGMELLVSYVANGGDLGALDKSCVNTMPAFDMTLSTTYQYYFLSTDDGYDGVYDKSLSGSITGSSPGLDGTTASSSGMNSTTTSNTDSGSSSTYKIIFVVFAVLFVLALVLAAFFAFRWCKLRREKSRSTLEHVTEPIVISTLTDAASASHTPTTPFTAQQGT